MAARPANDVDKDNSPATAKQVVLTHIRTAIRSGGLQPGQRIRERELAEACSVSRSAIREALVTLVAEGTLVHEHGHSPVVRQFTRAEIWAHHQIREALEGLAAGLAATRHDQVQFHEPLREIADRLESSAASGDSETYLQANYDFHALIIEMAGNPFIQAHIDQSHATQLRMQAARFMDIDGIKRSMEGHREILNAIMDGDATGAETAMRTHVRGTRRAFIEMPELLFRADASVERTASTLRIGKRR